MLSLLIGSPCPAWEDIKDIMQDYPNAAVYIDGNDTIQLVKVTDVDEFYVTTSVLVSPRYLKTTKLKYIKLSKYVAFPSFDEKVIKKLKELKSWHAIEYYEGDTFIGGWLLYDCRDCERKQKMHLEVNVDLPTDEMIKRHIQIHDM
ncbi:hypothetical protein CM19_07430 [Candidatus Acidianus copahuensis]|uniref:Uncharacterized protein n=2 Tax=Candidatus Acidianus copahuensis TaxID=1160895 RepID=A0A031LL90_9CREN|nr:hypothetical protein CM19_07430 [Candidatus Acidianus copahuensis]